ncbi:DUF3040 domain-containing protein [Jonesiaceae bacterium BS-20]|uniref:DUF3040 domain-containing protein n=1 Tax=Jonesiaceae bacterium BS-20 TaxID=3120821 RepID=A0AAU7DZQ1_9MICO
MPLSEHEQRILEQLERDLISEDPKLATALRSEQGNSVGKIIIAVVGVIVGLLLLVLGVAQGALWLGVVAFLLMFGAVTYAFAFPSRSQAGKGPGLDRNRPTARPSGAKQSGGSFMQRLEDRWDKRSRGE